MKEGLDNRIVQKIKEQLQSHEEDYQEGAWENFLTKKKEKKRRTLFLYFRGVAASIVIVLAVSLLFMDETQQDKNNKNSITKEKPKEPNNTPTQEETIKQKLIDEGNKSVIVDREGIHNQNRDSLFKDKSKHEKLINNAHPIVNSRIKKQNGSPNIKKAEKAKPKKEDDNETDRAIIIAKNQTNSSRKNITQEKDKGNKTESGIYLVKKSIADFNLKPITHLEIQLSLNDKKDELANNLEIFIEPIDENENRREQNNKKIEIGVLLSPGYGSNTNDNNSMASSSMGAGIAMHIPIQNSKLSFSTGAIFNALHITNDATIRTGQFSNENKTVNNNEATLYGIDIPLNLMYNISNSKIYIQTGISSYVTFNETMDKSSTFVREVEVYRFNNGVIESYTTTESVTTKETLKNDGVRFHPLGTINLSFGYRAPLSDKLIYEIQPFYKYPLSALTSDGGKIHTAGLTLKVIFSK